MLNVFSSISASRQLNLVTVTLHLLSGILVCILGKEGKLEYVWHHRKTLNETNL